MAGLVSFDRSVQGVWVFCCSHVQGSIAVTYGPLVTGLYVVLRAGYIEGY